MSSSVVDASENPPQEGSATEKEVGSKLETPEDPTELEKPHDEEPKQLGVNGTEKEELTEKTDAEIDDGPPKDEPETKSAPDAVAPAEPVESSEKTPQPVSALDTEAKNTEPHQQPVSENDPEPLPMKTPLAEGAPEPEPEKRAESVPQAEIQPAMLLQPVDTPSPNEEQKVETGAELQATMDIEAKEVGEEKPAEAKKVADSSETTPDQTAPKSDVVETKAAESEGAKSEQNDNETTKEEDTVPASGSLSFALLEKEQTKDAVLASRTLVVLRGLPGSGKSFLARFIANAYKEHCTVICADQHGIKPENPKSSAEGYKALDEAVVASCSTETASPVLIVVDDTNHTQDRLARLEEIAEEYYLVAVFLEPQTEWCRDPSQLAKKTRRGLDEAQLEAMKAQLEEMSIPSFFGWFLHFFDQEKVTCTSMDFLKTLDNLEPFKKHITDCKYLMWLHVLES